MLLLLLLLMLMLMLLVVVAFDVVSSLFTTHLFDGKCISFQVCKGVVLYLFYYDSFKEAVCKPCSKTTEKFQLVTKSRATEMYLLTPSQVNSLPSVSRNNPKKPMWQPMKLVMLGQVYVFCSLVSVFCSLVSVFCSSLSVSQWGGDN